MRLTCIIPTIGRSSLYASIMSVLTQLTDEDELLVVGDGVSPTARSQFTRAMVACPGKRALYLELPERTNNSGCSPCDYGVERATGDFVWFVGDDDRATAGAVAIIREAVIQAPDAPHLFAMLHLGRILQGTTACGRVSGQQIVVPRDMEKLPKMADYAALEVSDWEFINKVQYKWGKLEKHGEVIAELTALNRGEMF